MKPSISLFCANKGSREDDLGKIAMCVLVQFPRLYAWLVVICLFTFIIFYCKRLRALVYPHKVL